MMDALLSGVLGGLLGPPIGGYLGKLKYYQVICMGLIIGIVINVVLIVDKLIRLKGVYGFLESEAMNISKAGVGDLIFGYSAIPLLCIIMALWLKFFSPVPSWKEAESILLRDGYARELGGDGRLVFFTKGSHTFIARLSLRLIPSRLEWWKNGKHKGDILLRAE